MKARKLLWPLAIIGMALSPLATQAAPFEIFNINFNSDTVDAPPPTSAATEGVTSTNWSVYQGSFATVKSSYTDTVTSNTIGGGGDQVLVANFVDGSTTLRAIPATADAPTSGTVVVSWDMLIDSSNNTGKGLYLEFELNGNTSHHSLRLRMSANGELITTQSVGADVSIASQSDPGLTRGVKHSLAWTIDLDNKTATLSLDGSDLYTNLAWSTTIPTPTAGRIWWLADGDYNVDGGPVAIDNFVVTHVIPEPASLSLLAIGGGLICARRR